MKKFNAFTLAEVFHPAEQSKKFGFTLAEVLITLGIIGVVAALTMPSLIANYQKKQTVSKLQKDMATVQQAIKMSEAFNGETVNWTLPDKTHLGNTQAFAENYFFPYLKTIKTSIPTSEDCWADTKTIAGNEAVDYKISGFGQVCGCAVLNNGTSIYFWTHGPHPIDYNDHHLQISIDINGHRKGPNMLGKDVFAMIIPFKSGKIVPMANDYSRDEIISTTFKHGCNKDNQSGYAGVSCASLILKDSWQMSKDYPW